MKLVARKVLALLCLLLPGFTWGNHTKRAFLKEKLIITPIEQASDKFNNTTKIATALGLSILINWSLVKTLKKIVIYCLETYKFRPTNNNPHLQANVEDIIVFCRDKIPEVDINLLIPGLYFYTIYYVAHKIIFNRLNKAHFLKFIKEWKFNERYTPYEFRNAFEQLYRQYEKNQKLDQKKMAHLKQRISKFLLLKKA